MMAKGWKIGARRGQKRGQRITAKQAAVYDLIKQNPSMPRSEIADKLKMNGSVVRKHLDALKDKGIIKRVGPDKGGYWEVLVPHVFVA